MVREIRRRQHHLVARIDERRQRQREGVIRSGGDHDVVRGRCDAERPQTVRERAAQCRHSWIGRVDVDFMCCQRCSGRRQRRRRWTVERQRLSQRDHVVSRGAQFGRTQVERIEGRQLDGADTGRNGRRHVSSLVVAVWLTGAWRRLRAGRRFGLGLWCIVAAAAENASPESAPLRLLRRRCLRLRLRQDTARHAGRLRHFGRRRPDFGTRSSARRSSGRRSTTTSRAGTCGRSSRPPVKIRQNDLSS